MYGNIADHDRIRHLTSYRKMADFDAFETNQAPQVEEDPAAEFLAREQSELAGLEDDNFVQDNSAPEGQSKHIWLWYWEWNLCSAHPARCHYLWTNSIYFSCFHKNALLFCCKYVFLFYINAELVCIINTMKQAPVVVRGNSILTWAQWGRCSPIIHDLAPFLLGC